mmetsp:Transcript_19067/g.26758  ORF Transcript_19067/g.26758 Transcript_19067/m.26758 type:complete len:278 (-) Transcript_19067:1709-2542(-)
MSKRSGSLKGQNRRASMIPPTEEDLGGQDGFDLDNEEIDLQPVEKHIKPDTQIDLTEEQKDEVFTKTINAADPNVATSITRYDYEVGEYKIDTAVDHMAVHFSMIGDLIHIDSEEARLQIEMEEARADRAAGKAPKKKKKDAGGESKKDEEKKAEEQAKEEKAEGEEGGDAEKKEGDEGDEGDKPAEEEKKEEEEEEGEDDAFLKNQFNFSERATQTYNNPRREKEICTEPPPTVDFSENVTNWEVFDGYLEDLNEKMEAAAAAESKKTCCFYEEGQ